MKIQNELSILASIHDQQKNQYPGYIKYSYNE